MASVTLKQLVKKYGTVEAVKGIDLAIENHEFICLLGPSGCGKSSTLRMIAGLEEVTSGEILIGERLVNDLWPKERDIAMVFENYALYPHMTVYENMEFPLKSRKVAKEEIKKRISTASNILDIEELLNRNPSELSGGQKQRVAIGRAIVRDPEVFLMDEPISHLDAKLRDQMRGELKRLQKQLGATTVYVSHDQIEAMTMADRIAVMNLGELQQVAIPQEIFLKPANVFVGYFVGTPSMNFIKTELIEENGTPILRWDNSYWYEVPLRLREALNKLNANKVTLGVRPQNVSVSMEADESHTLEGEIFVTQPLGEDMLIEISMGNNRISAITHIDFPGRMKEKAWLEFDPNCIHLFDTKTEKNILYIDGDSKLKVTRPITSCSEKANQLKEKFSLQDAVVIPTPSDNALLKQELGRAAAFYFQQKVKDSQIIGVGMGTTLKEMSGFLKKKTLENLQVVSLMGSLTQKNSESPFEIASMIADAFNAQCHYISAPAVVDSAAAMSVIISEKSVHHALEIVRKTDIAVIGIGNITPDTSLIKAGYLSFEDLAQATNLGAVGDILGYYFDSEGKVLPCDFTKRMVGMSPDELSNVKLVIAAAGGKEKEEAILGYLRGGYNTTLITDEDTAASILQNKS